MGNRLRHADACHGTKVADDRRVARNSVDIHPCRAVCRVTYVGGCTRARPAARLLADGLDTVAGRRHLAAMRVIVTGAASGIGRATCLRLARDGRAAKGGAKIAAVDVGPSAGLDSLIHELAKLDAEGLAVHADMATADGPARAVEAATGRFGGLGGAVTQ